MKTRNGLWIGELALLAAWTAACGAAPTPQQVAAYPRIPSGGNSADGPWVGETVYLTLAVDNPAAAADQAAGLAYGSGGYENNRYAWEADGGRAVSQIIFVPVERAEEFRLRLSGLGWKKSESQVGGAGDPYIAGAEWTEFSIQYFPRRPEPHWNGPSFEQLQHGICGILGEAATFFSQAAASLLLIISVVLPCGLMIIGAAAVVRWCIGADRR
jgi:hypothetical protein